MFTFITILIILILFPVMLGSSLPFHMIKEEHRYKEKSVMSPIESIILGSIAILYVVTGCITKDFLYSNSRKFEYAWYAILIIAIVYYIFVLSTSLINKKTINVFGCALNSFPKKLGVFVLVIIVLLALLENLQVLSI